MFDEQTDKYKTLNCKVCDKELDGKRETKEHYIKYHVEHMQMTNNDIQSRYFFAWTLKETKGYFSAFSLQISLNYDGN